jgi:hypothetical protein
VAYNTIVVLGDLWERSEEARAGGTITPGMLLGQTTTALTQPGEHPRVVAHATAGGAAATLFAKEAGSLTGGTWSSGDAAISGGGIDDDYASGDTVFIHHARPGDEIYALLPASATAVVLTDYLTSNGDGTLKKAATTDVRIAMPLEAVDNSAGTEQARILVRIL